MGDSSDEYKNEVKNLAWGLFRGLAFIFTAVALSPKGNYLKRVKYTLIVCGCLCLLGMAGPIFSNGILWLTAVTGYAIGTPVTAIYRKVTVLKLFIKTVSIVFIFYCFAVSSNSSLAFFVLRELIR